MEKKSEKNKALILGLFVIAIVFTVILINSHVVKAESNVCCERLKSGAWCQPAPQSECMTGTNPATGQPYQTAATSCDQTNFCSSSGTCYDSTQGICESGVSQTVCNNAVESNPGKGFWSAKSPSEIPQCQQGCCLLPQGAFISTRARCDAFASQASVPTNFNSAITDSATCAASAGPKVKGACVYGSNGALTCSMTTKGDCTALQGNDSVSGATFYPGDLCTNNALNTNCKPTTDTKCVVGQDEVYFVDSCGNLANIYDASKTANKDPSYWQTIVQKNESCSVSADGAVSCGNCDGFQNICQAVTRGETPAPTYGQYMCKDLGCTYNGVHYQSGEQWCGFGETNGTATSITDPNQNGSYVFDGNSSTPNNQKENLPGSVYELLSCYNGQITHTVCGLATGGGRNSVCVESDLPTPSGGVFRNAACQPNTWQSCYTITNKKDCLDTSKGNCQWIPNEFALGSQNEETAKFTGICVPLNSPGFAFYNSSMNGDALCSQGTISLPYVIVSNGLNQYSFDKGSDALVGANPGTRTIKPSWVNTMTIRCESLGDCGPKLNYLGQPGETQTIATKTVIDGNGKQSLGDYVKTNGVQIQTPSGSYSSWQSYLKGLLGM